MASKSELVFTGQLSPDCKTIRLNSNEPARFLAHLLGEDIKITISKVRRNKSQQQLGYWWAVLVPHCQALWSDADGVAFSREDTHTRMMFDCVGAKLVPKKIGNFTYYAIDRPHLSEATVEEASNYIDAVVKYLAEAGIEVEAPGETGTLSDY